MAEGDSDVNLAIDIGGSKVELALHNSAGQFAGHRIDIVENAVPVQVIREIRQWLESRDVRKAGLQNIAVACAPNINAAGAVTRWPNRPQWVGINVIDSLCDYASESLLWCDDGVASTIADASFFDFQDLLHIVIGTGVGGSVVMFGRVLDTPEFGHHVVMPGGKNCVCSHNGCLQAYVSSASLDKAIKEKGEAALADWITEAAGMLAVFIQNIRNLFGISLVLVSGGMLQRVPELVDQINSILVGNLRLASDRPRIAVSPSGPNAPLAGAVVLSGNQLTKEKLDDLRCSVRVRQL